MPGISLEPINDVGPYHQALVSAAQEFTGFEVPDTADRLVAAASAGITIARECLDTATPTARSVVLAGHVAIHAAKNQEQGLRTVLLPSLLTNVLRHVDWPFLDVDAMTLAAILYRSRLGILTVGRSNRTENLSVRYGIPAGMVTARINLAKRTMQAQHPDQAFDFTQSSRLSDTEQDAQRPLSALGLRGDKRRRQPRRASTKQQFVGVPDWQAWGACIKVPDPFIRADRPNPPQSVIEAARKVCNVCGVYTTCRLWALSTQPETGIWGGMTPDERQAAND